jgi:hypothetical protein
MEMSKSIGPKKGTICFINYVLLVNVRSKAGAQACVQHCEKKKTVLFKVDLMQDASDIAFGPTGEETKFSVTAVHFPRGHAWRYSPSVSCTRTIAMVHKAAHG